jgi:branched-chain amino acid transport system substrate-binding protein
MNLNIGRHVVAGIVVASLVPATGAVAEDTIRIAYVDSLSGGMAGAGEVALQHFRFGADQINAAGGVLGQKIEIVPFDNKGDAHESRIATQKAVDQGIRYITQGISGSGVAAALIDFVNKYNSRNPGKEVLYLNYGATDPSLTNENCSYWHYRFDPNNDMKVVALMNYIIGRSDIKKVYLINQDYSTGRSVRDKILEILKAKRPDVTVVGDEVHPLMRVNDFSPYIAKIKASGADSVITGNWSLDISLLLKAAAEGGLQASWYTLYAYSPGGPTAIKQASLADKVFNASVGHANIAYSPAEEAQKAFREKYNLSMFYPQAVNELMILAAEMTAANSTDPMKVAPKLEDAIAKGFYGTDMTMRKRDHQLLQAYYVASFGPISPGMFDEEGTGWGWRTIAAITEKDSALPTTCNMDHP